MMVEQLLPDLGKIYAKVLENIPAKNFQTRKYVTVQIDIQDLLQQKMLKPDRGIYKRTEPTKFGLCTKNRISNAELDIISYLQNQNIKHK